MDAGVGSNTSNGLKELVLGLEFCGDCGVLEVRGIGCGILRGFLGEVNCGVGMGAFGRSNEGARGVLVLEEMMSVLR